MGQTLKRFAIVPCRTLNGEDRRNQFNLMGDVTFAMWN